jgi:hypothetical protein
MVILIDLGSNVRTAVFQFVADGRNIAYVHMAFSLGLVENLSLLDPTVPVNASMPGLQQDHPSIPDRSAGVRYTFHTDPQINNCWVSW